MAPGTCLGTMGLGQQSTCHKATTKGIQNKQLLTLKTHTSRIQEYAGVLAGSAKVPGGQTIYRLRPLASRWKLDSVRQIHLSFTKKIN